MRIIYVCSLLLMALVFSSCGDDNTPEEPNPPTDEFTICPDLSGQGLLDCISAGHSPTTSFTYAEAREHMYGNIDIWDDGLVHTIYSDYTITVNPNGSSPRREAFDKGVNTEHVFPQSMGAGEVPARSDIFHLFPCRENVNSARGNSPFTEINDVETDEWYYQETVTTVIPSENIDDYSEGTFTRWEPREAVKGDVARAVFYFFVIYNDVANQPFYEGMKDELLNWHITDPVDEREFQRNAKIRAVQGNENPFILDVELAARIVQ